MGKLFCDLDGVLGDFMAGVKQLAEKPWNCPSFSCEQDKWDLLNKIPRFWARLPLMPNAKVLWDQIVSFEPLILTACPLAMPQGEQEKKDWCLEHFGIPRERVIVVFSRHQKKEYAFTEGTPNILIDDYLPNVDDWRIAGGIGIHHLSVKESINALMARQDQS